MLQSELYSAILDPAGRHTGVGGVRLSGNR